MTDHTTPSRDSWNPCDMYGGDCGGPSWTQLNTQFDHACVRGFKALGWAGLIVLGVSTVALPLYWLATLAWVVLG